MCGICVVPMELEGRRQTSFDGMSFERNVTAVRMQHNANAASHSVVLPCEPISPSCASAEMHLKP